jgi:hypothetical protein
MRKVAIPALACALMASGCSSGGAAGGGSSKPATETDRAAALGCLRGQQKLDARPVGKDTVTIGPDRRGPRIRFFLNAGEAEAAQFEGREEGSEQIGSALLYVDSASKAVLDKVEACLDDLA